jgi:ABC-type multidrug transport system ATPase subunit
VNEIIVTSLLKIYALITSQNSSVDSLLARNFVETFLRKNFNQNTVREQIVKFDTILNDFNNQEELNIESTVTVIGERINKELPIKQKYLILIYILQFVQHWRTTSSGIETENNSSDAIIYILVQALRIDNSEFADLVNYISDSHIQIKEKHKIIIVHDNPYFKIRGINTIQHSGLDGELIFYKLSYINAYLFKYKGTDKIQIQGQSLFPNHIYFFDKGASIKAASFKPLYYSAVVAQYLSGQSKAEILFHAKDIEYRFPKSENGIHKFSLEGSSGQILGIMGGSGTGKSTLLNLFNGNIIPDKGQITINGFDIHDNKNQLKGVMGYIPQDDLLIDELTVYQNLYYNAKLCLGNLSELEIADRLTKILAELDLTLIAELKVGSPLNKFISGGQRKRLNIALELIREPYVLFVDEPTSGLSSSDSEKVMELLKEQALSGKYLVVNIHQPSSDIYKLFDNILVLDKGGFPIFIGNPIDAIEYVKAETGMIDAAESFCNCCNNINPELVLQTIELQKIDEFGEFTQERKINPIEWYQKFTEKLQPRLKFKTDKIELPLSNLKLPKPLKQFAIFSMRNLRSKLADKQYLVISLFVSPVLALILSFLVRHLEGDNGQLYYSFLANENIPAYIFMSIIVALFIGLIVSAEEIFQDKKILKRESFLNLSQVSYYNSKIILLFFVSAIQTLSFVLIGNFILELKGVTISYWLVLFSLSCFANMVGLNISSAFKSAVTIYIIIPLVLVPQILLGGVIVNFDKLQNSIATKENVPLVGDLMASRWAYEAMMVTQFKENEYEKIFFDIEKQISQSSFLMNYKIPRLINITNDIIRAKKNKNSEINASMLTDFILLNNEISSIQRSYKITLTKESLSAVTAVNNLVDLTKDFVALKIKLAKHVSKLMYKKDDKIKALGQTKVIELKERNFNNRVAEFVLNNREINRIKQVGSKLVQSYEPIYLYPNSKFGRSHFFSPIKVLGSMRIDTLWFNIAAIWFMTLVLYFMLIFNVFKRIIR